MVEVNGTTITMTRGDTARISVFITDSEGDQYIPEEGDSIRFAAKQNYTDGTPLILIDVPTDSLVFTIQPDDTKNLAFGNYVYDIELTKVDGTVDTFITKAKLKITEEVH